MTKIRIGSDAGAPLPVNPTVWDYVRRADRETVRLGLRLIRAWGFRCTEATALRLANRIGAGRDAHGAATAELRYRMHLALCPDRTIFRGMLLPRREGFTIGM